MSYLQALKFNRYSVRHDFLRTQRQNLPPFTLSPETLKEEEERGRKVFREISNNIPVMREPVSTLRMTLKALVQSTSWVPVI
uniref:Uncharacterized protein n=1 Tax=Candidatus Caldatribacterium californiense TaxID=1454726 RepID=A0A7V3YHF2_9BACT